MSLDDSNAHRLEADSFNVQYSLELLKSAILRNKAIVLLTPIFTIALVVIYMVIWPPIYKAQVLLIADHSEDRQRESFYQYWNVFRSDHLPDEVQMMSAGPLLEKVIRKLDLTYDEVYHPFLSYLGHLWTTSWGGKKYRSFKKMIFPPKESHYTLTQEDIDFYRVFFDFKKGVGLSPISETNMGNMIVKGSTPRVAEIANVLVDTYLEERLERHVKEAENAYESLRLENEKAYAELAELEMEMKRYFDENSIYLMFEKDKVELARWLDLKATLVDTDSVIATIEKTMSSVEEQIKLEKEQIISARVMQRNPLKENLKNRLNDLKLLKKHSGTRFLPESPEIKDIEKQIASVQDLIAQEKDSVDYQKTIVLNNSYEAMRSQLNELRAQLSGARAGREIKKEATDELKRIIESIPEKMEAINIMDRQHKILEKKYMMLHERMTMAQISKATAKSAPQSMRIIEPASVPEKPSWPNKKLLLAVAGLLGLIGGVCIALLIEAVHTRVGRYHTIHNQNEFQIYAVLKRDTQYLNGLFEPNRQAAREIVE